MDRDLDDQNDLIKGLDGKDFLNGLLGDNLIVGGDGDGTDSSGTGGDTIFGGAANGRPTIPPAARCAAPEASPSASYTMSPARRLFHVAGE